MHAFEEHVSVVSKETISNEETVCFHMSCYYAIFRNLEYDMRTATDVVGMKAAVRGNLLPIVASVRVAGDYIPKAN